MPRTCVEAAPVPMDWKHYSSFPHPFLLCFKLKSCSWVINVACELALNNFIFLSLFILLRNVSNYHYFLFTSKFLLFYSRQTREKIWKTTAAFLFFLWKNSPLGNEKRSLQRRQGRIFYGNFWPKSPYFKVESSQLPYLDTVFARTQWDS